MYHCDNEKFCETIEDDLFHIDNCTCHHVHAWWFFIADQSDHIRAYCEYNKIFETHYDIRYGVCLRYLDNIGKFFDAERKIGYPY